MSIVKRGKRWGVKVRAGGKQHWVGTFDTRTSARKAEAEFIAAYRPGGESDLTCDEFAGFWTERYPRKRASTNQTNRLAVSRFGEQFKNRKLSSVTRTEARAFALANPSRLSAVRAMYSDALNDGLVTTNPFAGLRLSGSRGRKDIIVPSVDDVDRLADAARRLYGEFGEQYASMILFAAYTAMRPGEIVVLEWSDIDFKNDEITVSKTLSADKHIEAPKNGKTRTIVLLPEAREALRMVPRSLDGRIFSTQRGRRYSKSTFHYYWNPVRSAIGRPDMDFYELRHFACTYLLDELGLSPGDAAHQLGHTDGGRLVMELYGHPSEDLTRARIKEAAQKTGERSVTPLRTARQTQDA